MRVGIGYDVHRLEYNHKLILGGVLIPHEKGLIAHSDGDCLIHAIIDSILGAAGLYDIGTYFPDNNEKFKNISSLELLKETYKCSLSRFLLWFSESRFLKKIHSFPPSHSKQDVHIPSLQTG